MHEPVLPLHTYGHTAPLFCQVPLLVQTWGCWPLHWTAPGVHEPVHAPATQAWLVQAAAEPHWPAEVHVCTALVTPPSPPVAHCVAPGVHTPAQAPLTQAWFEHACGLPHWPPDVHVCTCASSEHCVLVGLHATHDPPRQTGVPPVHGDGFPHWPLELQVWPSLPSEHWIEPGVHTPEQVPLRQT